MAGKTEKKPQKPVVKKKVDEAKPKPEPKEKPPEYRGKTNELGELYMETEDFLRWSKNLLRIKLCMAEAGKLRAEVENMRLKVEAKAAKMLETALSWDRAVAKHAEDNAELVTQLSKDYNLDFKDPNVTIDDESGKISVIDPEKGLPRLREE